MDNFLKKISANNFLLLNKESMLKMSQAKKRSGERWIVAHAIGISSLIVVCIPKQILKKVKKIIEVYKTPNKRFGEVGTFFLLNDSHSIYEGFGCIHNPSTELYNIYLIKKDNSTFEELQNIPDQKIKEILELKGI